MNRKLWFPLIIACIPLIALLTCLAGCSLHKTENEKLNESVSRAFEDAFNKGEVNALDKYLATDFVMHHPPFSDIKGLYAYKKVVAGVRSRYPDVELTMNSLIMQGNTSASRLSEQFTDTSTGKHVKATGCTIFQWVNGKAVECWLYGDYLGQYQQRGYKLIPPLTKTTFARVHINQVKLEKMAEVMQMYRERFVPVIKSQKGFLGLYGLTNDTTGKSVSITLWDSEADAMASMEAENYKALSNEFTEKFKSSVTGMEIREGYSVTVRE
jgi:predicted ester cyclase/heme-degrading monooxygenase HmoA